MKSLITLISVLFTLNSIGQVSVGPDIGMSFHKVEDQQISNDYQIGLNGGLAVEYKFTDNLALHTGVYYQQVKRGSTSNDTIPFDFFGLPDTAFAALGLDMNTYSATESRHTLHYLQLPITANFNYYNVNVFAGFYLGYLIGAKQKSLTQNNTPFVTTIDISGMDPTGGLLGDFFPEPYEEFYEETTGTDGLKRFDYGIKAGLGYTMKNFSVNGSYNYSFPKFAVVPEGERFSNHYFQVGIRYMIPLIGKVGGPSSIK